MGMAIKSPVIVMALYDIGRDRWNSFQVSYNTYLNWMQNTLSLDANIVIYTEKKFVNDIVKMRKQFDRTLDKTKIVILPLNELDCFKLYFDDLENLMNCNVFKNKCHHSVPEMNRPLYNVIMFNKLNFLKHTKDNNYFNNDFLIWADAGGLREYIGNYKDQVWPNIEKINKLDNNKVTFFSHTSDFEIENKEYHAMSQTRYIQGTAFFVPSHLIDSLILEFNKVIEDCLDNCYIGSDEKIFDLLYVKDKSKYHFIKCSWREYFDIFK